MKRLSQLMAALLLCFLIACTANNEKPQVTRDKAVANKEFKKTMGAISGNLAADSVAVPGNPPQSPAAGITTQTKQEWDKKIIKTGHLTLEVKTYAVFNELLHQEVKQLGGYIAQEEQTQAIGRIENTVTIKIPVDQFDNAVARLTPTPEKIIEMKITAEDVTGEIVDTQSRLEAKKRVRDRYLDLLKQAKNMAEVLEVQNEVNGIQENIESGAGRIGYLSHAAAFSTINIRFYQLLPTGITGDTRPGYGERLVESFKSGVHWFAELLVVMVSLWPLWTGIIAAWVVVRKRIRFQRVKKAAPVS